MKTSGILKKTLGPAFATFLSRILGLIRVMLEAQVLGGGAIASTWAFAFMFPNLLRRLLGEGALGTALTPMISHKAKEQGIIKARQELGIIFVILGLLLIGIILLVTIFAFFFGSDFKDEYKQQAFKLLPIIMPYAFFICLTGASTAVLSTKRVFFLPALGALILNICLITVLIYYSFLDFNSKEKILYNLSLVVVISGVLQLLFMCILLYYYKIFPIFKNMFKELSVVKELSRLALPGLIGAGALQISFLIDRSIALGLGPQALPALHYTERIVYLPIGIFAISIGSVLVADMSKSAAEKNYFQIIESMIFSLRHVIFFCIPIAIFIMLFKEEIIASLFFKGKFTLENLYATSWAMVFYASGIPFFCATKVITPVFFAQKKMLNPMYISLIVICINIIFNFALMIPLKQGGLALATVISSIAHNGLLLYYLPKEDVKFSYKPTLITAIKTIISVIVAISITYYFFSNLDALIKLPQIYRILMVCLKVIIFLFIYITCMWLLKAEELQEVLSVFKKKIKQKTQISHNLVK